MKIYLYHVPNNDKNYNVIPNTIKLIYFNNNVIEFNFYLIIINSQKCTVQYKYKIFTFFVGL